MKSEKFERVKWTVISAISLYIGFLICRYLLFDLHGMREWPFDLFIFGIFVICVAGIFNAKRIMLCTVSGYCVGFFMGVLFEVKWIDSNGASRNNLWIWFTLTMIVFVSVGVVWEIVNKINKSNK